MSFISMSSEDEYEEGDIVLVYPKEIDDIIDDLKAEAAADSDKTWHQEFPRVIGDRSYTFRCSFGNHRFITEVGYTTYEDCGDVALIGISMFLPFLTVRDVFY